MTNPESITPEHPSSIWYRYEDRRYAAMLDEYERPSGSGRTEIEEQVFEVVRRTPKGVWLVQVWRCGRSSTERFVRLSARKRFAHPTRKAAMASFLARKRAQVNILERQLENARLALGLGKMRAHDLQAQHCEESSALEIA